MTDIKLNCDNTGTVRVVSKRSGAKRLETADETVEYIGRPSALGNPFPMVAEHQRAAVIARYRIWLSAEYQKKGAVFSALNNLVDRVCRGEHIALQCWCAPRACHGDAIKRAIEYLVLKSDDSARVQLSKEVTPCEL